jgi:hypothetical protein
MGTLVLGICTPEQWQPGSLGRVRVSAGAVASAWGPFVGSDRRPQHSSRHTDALDHPRPRPPGRCR